MPDTKTLLVGSFTPLVGATGAGISVVGVTIEDDVAQFSRRADVDAGCPTYMTPHPTERFVYVASEAPLARLYTFRVSDKGDLTLVDSVATAPNPTHISVGRVGASLYAVTSHYWGGCFALHRVLDDGTLGEPLDIVDRNAPGTDPEGRPSRAHSAYFVGDGFIVAADLGHDKILTFVIDEAAGTLVPRAELSLPGGSGPRHLAFHRDGRIFVAGESEGSVMTITVGPDGRGIRLVDRRPAMAEPVSDPPARAVNVPAEIALSHGDRYLHIANREVNVVTTFDTTGARLVAICDTKTGGECPRHIFVDGDYLYVANQVSGLLTALAVDPLTGTTRLLEGAAPIDSAAYVRVSESWEAVAR